MNILVIHHFSEICGGTISGINVADLLTKQHNVFYYAPKNRSNTIYNYISNNKITLIHDRINLFIFNYRNGGNKGIKLLIKTAFKFFLFLKSKRTIKKIVKENHIDLVLFNSIIQFPMSKFFKSLNVKTCCFIRETMNGVPHSKINKFIRNNLNKMDAIAFISEFDKKQWDLKKDITQEVIENYPSINFIDSLKNENYKNEKFTLLYMGGFSEIKGIETMLMAMQELDDNYKLLILGDDGTAILNSSLIHKFIHKKQYNFVRKMYRLIQSGGFNDNIEILGNRESTTEFFNKADVLICPTKVVHQARPIFEAGYAKKTVIVSEFPNFCDDICDKKNGLFFKCCDHSDLADKIRYLYNNPNIKNNMDTENYIMATTKHSSDNSYKKLLKLIKTLN